MAIVEQLAVLKALGADAGNFLQGQFTADVEALEDGSGCLAAYCNQKGRLLALFEIFSFHEAYYLLLPADVIGLLQARLQQFSLRSDVQFENLSSDHSLVMLADAADCAHHKMSVVDDGLVFGLPWLAHALHLQPTAALTEAGASADTQWLAARIEAGVPTISKSLAGKYLAHPLNLVELNAISFKKGCYVGQEIIARTQFRGRAKKHVQRAVVQLTEGSKVIQPGDAVMSQGAVVGEVVNVLQGDDGQNQLLVLLSDQVLNQVIELQDSGEVLQLLSMPFEVNVS